MSIKAAKEPIKKTKVIGNTMYVLKFCFRHAPTYTVFMLIDRAKYNLIVFVEFTLLLSYLINTIQSGGSFRSALIFTAAVMAFKMSMSLLNIFCIDARLIPAAEARLSGELRRMLFEKASEIDLVCYDDPNYYNDFVWAMSQAFERVNQTMKTLSEAIGSVALFFMTGAFMISSDVLGIAFAAVSYVLMFSVNMVLNERKFELEAATKPLVRKRDYFSRVFYLNDYSKELRLSDVKTKLFKDFRRTNDEMNMEIDKASKPMIALSFLRDFIFNDMLLDGIYTIYLLFRAFILKTLPYGTMVALFNAVNRMRGSMAVFADTIPQMRQNSLYIDKIRAFLDYDVKIKGGTHPVPEETQALELKDVSFSYATDRPDALKHVDMVIRPGEKIAIVGYNGAGKTTLVKLLTRLYEASDGHISYGGETIKKYDAEAYRGIFGTVFQDYQLFAVTLLRNVAMRTGEVDREKAKNALIKAVFGERLASLPQGLDTYYTKEFDEGGMNFSIGESQKIAISRTLFKDSRVIILDEPSSALDPIAESNLNNTILNNGKAATIIIISHRLSTTKLADRIYMFDGGKIVESGTHEELMAANGKYAEMFNMQSEKYQLFAEFKI